MGVNGEALQLHAVCIFTTSHVRIRTASHVCCFCNEINGSYDKIIITIVSSYTGEKYHSFFAVGIVTRAVHS